jgi:hypothetical protein
MTPGTLLDDKSSPIGGINNNCVQGNKDSKLLIAQNKHTSLHTNKIREKIRKEIYIYISSRLGAPFG